MALLNVLPSSASLDVRDCWTREAVNKRKIHISFSAIPYLTYNFFRDLTVYVEPACRSIRSAFETSVDSIIRRCTFKKMLRISALRIIAFMQNEVSCRVFPVVKHPRKARCWYRYGQVPKLAVSVFVLVPKPFPARARLINKARKAAFCFLVYHASKLTGQNRGVK